MVEAIYLICEGEYTCLCYFMRKGMQAATQFKAYQTTHYSSILQNLHMLERKTEKAVTHLRFQIKTPELEPN